MQNTPPTENSSPDPTVNILLVDNQPAHLLTLRAILEDLGQNLVEAPSGKEALRLLRDLDGYEDVPAVLFSTSNLPHDAQFARSYGAGFISKPLSSIQMDIIVKNFLDYCKENAG